jgi:hypothetical protein
MNKEEWKVIEEFPDFAISNRGEVLRIARDIPLTPGVNQQGIPYVRFNISGRQNVRSVAVLVADAFLEPVGHDWLHFDTPINLNGDRCDNRVENLLWRPRWFAVKFHKERRAGSTYEVTKKFYEVDTEEIFNQPCEAAIKWGLLEYGILDSILSGESVFPDWQQFEFLPEDL